MAGGDWRESTAVVVASNRQQLAVWPIKPSVCTFQLPTSEPPGFLFHTEPEWTLRVFVNFESIVEYYSSRKYVK
jgi:hypothetical protein